MWLTTMKNNPFLQTCDGYFSDSGRTPGKKRAAAQEEEEDLTAGMDDPTPEPNIQEVHIPKSSKST